MITFTVPGQPKGKQSVQNVPLLSCSSCGRRAYHWQRLPSGKRQCECGCNRLYFEGMQEYTPSQSRGEMKNIATFARCAAAATGQCEPIANEVTITIDAYFKIAKSRKELAAGQPHGQKPDADNIAKAVLDGIRKGLVIVDDCQVSDLIVRKTWTDGESKLEVSIEPFKTA